jgi:signal recognition particle receptor subunit beta
MLQKCTSLGDDSKHIKIALMGVTGSGKTTFIKTATQDPNVQIGENLGSCS